MLVFWNRVLRSEGADFGYVWEQGTGERRGQILTLFGNRLLARGERIINTVLQSAAEGRGQNMTYFRNSFLERGEDLF